MKDEDKKNLYFQYKIRSLNFGKIFTVDACSFSENPSEEDVINFKNNINNLEGIQTSDAYFSYYKYKIPKFENFNWLVIRTTNTYDYRLSLTSFYVYSENDKDKDNNIKLILSFIIALTVITVINTLLIAFILFKIFIFKKQLSEEIINNKLN